jgi:hypothetical protein
VSNIDGTWFAAEAPLTFLFHEQESHVAGVFHHENIFTCDLKGTLVGRKLTFDFETIWSWLNVHDTGSATLDVSADGATLSGPVTMSGKPGRWSLTRAQPAVRPPVAPAAPPSASLPFPIRQPARSYGPLKSPVDTVWPYHERIAKDVWDAQRDPALLQRLRKRAESEPELDALLKRRNM